MTGCRCALLVVIDFLKVAFPEYLIPEFLINVFHGLTARMDKVLRIEAVIPQFIHHNLVGREIVAPRTADRQLQRGLGESVDVGSVPQMAYGRDREDEPPLLRSGDRPGDGIDAAANLID